MNSRTKKFVLNGVKDTSQVSLGGVTLDRGGRKATRTVILQKLSKDSVKGPLNKTKVVPRSAGEGIMPPLSSTSEILMVEVVTVPI